MCSCVFPYTHIARPSMWHTIYEKETTSDVSCHSTNTFMWRVRLVSYIVSLRIFTQCFDDVCSLTAKTPMQYQNSVEYVLVIQTEIDNLYDLSIHVNR